MRITIPTTGSRGDVQPYVALGVGLQAAGHQVRLATHEDFETLVRGHGLDFYPITVGGRALQGSALGDQMVGAGNNPMAFMRHFAGLRLPLMHQLVENTWNACQDADMVLVSMTAYFIGWSVAEKLQVPACLLSLQPTSPSRFLANSLFPDGPSWPVFGQLYNLLTHAAVGGYFWKILRGAVNGARREVLDLPPVHFWGPSLQLLLGTPTLSGYSRHVVPKPRDWNDNHYVTGYWFLKSSPGWQPPAELVDFLAAGPPPVCVGFGSMHSRDAGATTALVEQALARAGQRGILLAGWDGLSKGHRSDRVLCLESAPHDWLYPRVAAVVHHGGAGTTASALRAGVPAVVVPHMADQPFWGRRVHALGVGPQPILRKQLTAERLAEGVRQAAGDPRMRERARELGAKVRAEDGIGRAREALEHEYELARRPARQRRPTWALPPLVRSTG